MNFVLQTRFEFLTGNFWHNSTALGLAIIATAAFVVGCGVFFGGPGVGIAMAITILIGVPLSGASVPWQFLLEPFGAIGQHMVPGASNTLIRSLSFFPEAATATQWTTLIA